MRDVRLPDLGEGLTEAEIVAVLVREGDVIAEDAPLLEVETDKAQVEIPSPIGGRVEKIHVAPGQTRARSARRSSRSPTAPRPRRPHRARSAPATPPAKAPMPARSPRGRPLPRPTAPAAAPRTEGPAPATPATRRLARELGVDLQAVRGSGPGGRVTDEDVRAAVAHRRRAPQLPRQPRRPPRRRGPPSRSPPSGLEAPPLPRFEQWGPVERAPLSHLRRTIAERMTLSATLIPHVTHFDRADITDLDAIIARNLEAARGQGVTLTLTAFLLKAAALALARHPTSTRASIPARAS